MREDCRERLLLFGSTLDGLKKGKRTLPINWKFNVLNLSVVAEYVAEAILSYVLREAFDDNLGSLQELAIRPRPTRIKGAEELRAEIPSPWHCGLEGFHCATKESG